MAHVSIKMDDMPMEVVKILISLRADIHTLMAGFALFSVLADKCRASAVTVTDASVRDGYLKERLMKND